MQITSNLSFPSMFFRHWDLDGCEMGVLIVKGSFQIDKEERSKRILRLQPDILLSDAFYGEANASPLKQESEVSLIYAYAGTVQKSEDEVAAHAYNPSGGVC